MTDGMKQLLTEAKNEIMELRQRNNILSAKVEVIEVFAAAYGIERNHCMKPDVVYDIDQAIRAAEVIDESNAQTPRHRGESVADNICHMARGCTFSVEERDRLVNLFTACTHG